MGGSRVLLWVAIVVVAAWFLYLVRSILFPFFVGFLVAGLLEPSIRQLRLRGFSRGGAVFTVFGLFVVIVTVVSVLAAPKIAAQVRAVKDIGTEYISTTLFSPDGPIDNFLESNEAWLRRLNLPTTLAELERDAGVRHWVNKWVGGALRGAGEIVQYFLSSVILVVLTPIITLLILLDYDTFKRRLTTWIPPAIRRPATDLMTEIGEVLGAYVRGVILSISIYAALMAALLWVLGVPFALFLGILLGVFYLVPYLGSVISMAAIWLSIVAAKAGTDTLLFELGNQGSYIVFCLAVFVVTDRIYDLFVHPRIVGRAVGLHPVVSFFVILSGAALFGLVGMILAFPIAGTIKVILDRLIRYTTTREVVLNLPRIPKRHTA